jgi:hypothetical protein
MPAPWPMSDEELAAASSTFGVDRVPGRPDVTDFKRRARWQQAWWRAQHSLPLGAHRSPGSTVPTANGSRVDDEWARRSGCNFLSPAIRDAVENRLAHPEPHQTLNDGRLWTDLLSSMPLCFNLFGELFDDHARLVAAVDKLWPNHPGDPGRLQFEWSPGRRDPLYLNNRSAFDAAIILRLTEKQQGVIGMETKYHEDIRRERAPHPQSRLPRYRDVTERSEVFRPGWEPKLIGTDLQQFWLDHLLVLSMLQHPSGRWSWGRFVVVYPAKNPSVRDAAERYSDLLATRDTFEARTIEELLDANVLHQTSTAGAFRDRYLW